MVIKNWRRALLPAAVLALVAAAPGAPAAASAPAAEYERIVNGDFSAGSDPWWTGANTSGSVTGGEYCVAVTGGTANGYDALSGQNGVPYEAGQSYTLSFDARATVEQPISAVAGEAVAPYRQIARTDVTVTPVKQTFTFTFESTLDFPTAGNGQFAFWFGGQSFDNTVCVDNVSVVGGVLPPPGLEPAPPLRVNQVGYVPGVPKQASFATDSTTPLPWTLRDSAGTSVATGQTVPKGHDAASDENVHTIDFSSYDREGSGYTLTVGDVVSHPFDISATAMSDLRYDSLAFFYHQRSGTPIEAQYVGEEYARPAGHVNVAPNRGDDDVPCRADLNCGYTLDVRGGWYDAGDHGKYVVNGGISAWQLQNSYERAALIGDEAAMGDGTLAIPEQSNGVPDVLDEARWEVEFLLSMQVPDGQPLAGMAHHKIHDEQWTGLPTLPHEDAQPRRLSAPSTAATLNLAAVAAQASRLWAPYDAEFSARTLAVAKKAYAAAKANPSRLADPNDGTGGGAYSDSTVTDEFYWAAAELFATTGEYRADVTGSALYGGKSFNVHGFDWAATGALGDVTLLLVPRDLPADAVRAALLSTADAHLANMAGMGHPAPYRTADGGYEWGSNGLVANNGVVLGLAHDLTGAAKYRDGAFAAMDYLLGRNPVDHSYVAGWGDQPVRNVHHRHWANQLDPSLPTAPAGALSGGPNSALQDPIAARLLPGCAPQRCWVDHIEAYSLNEVTVNWNSALAWLSNWVAEHSVPSAVPSGCKVAYTASTWQTGMTAQLTMTNTGTSAWDAWRLEFAFSGGERIQHGWSATWTQTDRAVRAENVAWNTRVAPGASVTLGFNASKTGTHTPPAAFKVNGQVCTNA
ncbi:glycoside hydrolase family 9 protein [Actinophytocola algeriensis]|uniref:Endoglucanase n=1 Tax=Actinophytocola algeriensis TaxID=1768010 RepID=A0A7W7VCY4_9PSEU|nr:glycoside hydrolase family 9 protein [Actinophytocola algeriensis]MBB4905534.1 endoglucanase [Actinophytocola algeriensis]MBE1472781.1 endoglucanase [Actinophytocola algeriensis]